jgi:aspartate/methionine/tyrosine aminotransferase
MTLIASRIAKLGTENAFRLGADIDRCRERGLDVIRLNLGEPDFDSAPHINAVAAAEIAAGNSHYCDPAGLPSLRRAISAHLRATRGLDVALDRIVVTPGAKPTIGYTVLTYVEPGDEVVYPSPGFPIYESWIHFCGGRPVPLPLSEERGFAFSPQDLAERISERTRLIILCSPSNPTGGVLSLADLAGVAEVVRERCAPDVRVFSDEIYEHILFDGETHHSIACERGMEERTVVSSGCSKGFAMTGWRLGWAVLPTSAEAAIFKQLNVNLVSCVPPFVQEAAREAYESPRSAPVVKEMVAAFEERRDWVVPALNEIDGVRAKTPKGAFYVFPNVEGVCRRLGVFEAFDGLPAAAKAKASPSAMLQMFLLYRYGVATMDRASFGRLGAEGEHFLRLSIAASLDQLEEGVRRIGQAAGDREGFARFVAEERLWT